MSKDIFTVGSFFHTKNGCIVKVNSYNEVTPFPVETEVVYVPPSMGNEHSAIRIGSRVAYTQNGQHSGLEVGRYDLDLDSKCDILLIPHLSQTRRYKVGERHLRRDGVTMEVKHIGLDTEQYPVRAEVVVLPDNWPNEDKILATSIRYTVDGRYDHLCEEHEYDLTTPVKADVEGHTQPYATGMTFYTAIGQTFIVDGAPSNQPEEYPIAGTIMPHLDATGVVVPGKRVTYTIDGKINAWSDSDEDLILSTGKIATSGSGAPVTDDAVVFTLTNESESFDDYIKPFNVQGYEQLARVLRDAYGQSAEGKGKERHANDLPFHQQPMGVIADMPNVGKGGLVYQIIKKAGEASGMAERGNTDHAIHELHGVIVYTAGLILHLERMAVKQNNLKGDQS